MQNFFLFAGQSCHVLSVDAAGAPKVQLLYRISVDEIIEVDLKIIRDGTAATVISHKQRHKAIDVVTSGNLYMEAIGKSGYVTGTYDCIKRC